MKLQDRKGVALMGKSILRGGKMYCMIGLCTLSSLLLPCPGDASAASARFAEGVRSQKEELLCSNIKEKIMVREDIRRIVKTSIQMGYSACGVIKCSIQEGGDLRQVIIGAVEAGVTKDVVSKCALDAGADAKTVALILDSVSASGLCYVLPEMPEVIIPPAPVFISPSGFR